MKLVCSQLLLFVVSSVALQTPVRSFIGGATAAAALVSTPLQAPAQDAVPPTTIVVDVKSKSDIAGTAKDAFAHRGQVQQAFKDFLGSVKILESDLDGVVSPPEVSIRSPSDAKQAARDALSGQARLLVNDNPIYFEVDSQEGFLTLKAVSPLIPKLPLLDPTPAEEATMVIPRTTTVYVKSPDPLPEAPTKKPFWEWTFNAPFVKEVTLPQAVGGAIVGLYGVTYGYHKLEQGGVETKQRGKSKKSKAMAPKKVPEKKTKEVKGANAKATADKAAAPKNVSEEMTKEVEDAMKEAAEVQLKVSKNNLDESTKSVEASETPAGSTDGEQKRSKRRFLKRVFLGKK